MYSTCPDENHQAPTQCFARGAGRFTNIDIRLGACTKEGDIELTDLGPYEVQEQHPFFFNFPDNAQDWHQKYGILSKQAAEDGLRYDRVNMPKMSMNAGDFVPDSRPDWEPAPVVDLWKLSGYLAEIINKPHFHEVDTMVIYTDDRHSPPES